MTHELASTIHIKADVQYYKQEQYEKRSAINPVTAEITENPCANQLH